MQCYGTFTDREECRACEIAQYCREFAENDRKGDLGMRKSQASIESVAALERCMESDGAWVTIDEVGYLEAKSDVYHDALRQLLEKKQVAMVIRKQDLPFLQEVCSRKDAFVVSQEEESIYNGIPSDAVAVLDFKGLGEYHPLLFDTLSFAHRIFDIREAAASLFLFGKPQTL